MTSDQTIDAVNEKLPSGKLMTLGLQHVLVMYAGAIAVTLMRVGINWIFGIPVGPTAPQVVDPAHAAWLARVTELGAGAVPDMPGGLKLAPTLNNVNYATPQNMMISALVLGTIVVVMKYARGFLANASVLIGIVTCALAATSLDIMQFDHVAKAGWFELVTPFRFGLPIFDPVMILTMTLVTGVVMIEFTGMFMAVGDICGKKIERPSLSAGLRTGGLGTLIGGRFNTFPCISFSQNVGLVGVTGIRAR
ncbi:solute carrier family 23 protein [Fluviibacterium sp. DFM31]|uniref:Solute carrier family 23 protein n=1 Tax=Meridianimarinicoccus marinus TaxID=3231483 RepID=A0ABV3LBS7_9RHOB